MNHSDECVKVEYPHGAASLDQSRLEVLEVGEALTFAQGVRAVLRGVGRLAAALRAAAAAGGQRGPSHLDGFVSNDRRELFTLQRTERDRQASGVEGPWSPCLSDSCCPCHRCRRQHHHQHQHQHHHRLWQK